MRKIMVVVVVLIICLVFIISCTVEVVENIAPVADAGTNQTLYVDQTVQFDGSSSSDDGSIVSYYWDFGDTFTANIVGPTHPYSVAGDYDVTLTVTDNDGATDDNTIVITIEDLYVGTWEWLDEPAPNGVLDAMFDALYSFTFSDSFELKCYDLNGLVWGAKGTMTPNIGAGELVSEVTQVLKGISAGGSGEWVTSGHDDWTGVMSTKISGTTFTVTYSIVDDNTMTIDVGSWLTWLFWTSGSRSFTK